ncbi:MAG: hypothetical protein OXU48_08395, partial [candidate division Zixibacteria bacterium]|nr:hypothetical protein [candidate division Zixibacteria bacterium]
GIAALIGRSRRKAEEAEEEEGDDDGDGGGEGGGGEDNGERPALTTGEPDTPTLPRDSSTPAGEQRTGRGYWPDDDEFIYDYDVEMGYSEEPEDKADEDGAGKPDQGGRRVDGDPASSDATDQKEAETDETGGSDDSGKTNETSGDDSTETDETGGEDATDSDRSDDDKKN